MLFPIQAVHRFGQQIIMAESNGVVRLDQPVRNRRIDAPRAAAVTPVAPRQAETSLPLIERHVREVIIDILASALRIDAALIDVDESFADYGLDSIIGVQTANKLNDVLRIKLNSTSLFDHSTVNALTAHILATQKSVLANLLAPPEAPASAEVVPSMAPDAGAHAGRPARAIANPLVERHVREVIIDTLASALRIDAALIDVDESFADYGLDSIIGVQTANKLNEVLRIKLNSTSLFDYSTVNALTAHILATQKSALANLLAVRQVAAPMARMEKVAPAAIPHAAPSAASVTAQAEPAPQPASAPQAIAIIGMSGRFARSTDTGQLWTHLAAGDELIEDVSRWDSSQYVQPTDVVERCARGGFVSGIDEFDRLVLQHLRARSDLHGSAAAAVSGGGLEGAGGCGLCGRSDRRTSLRRVCRLLHRRLRLRVRRTTSPAQAFWGNAVVGHSGAHCLLPGPARARRSRSTRPARARWSRCIWRARRLRSDEIDMALAGGVYVQCTPELLSTLANRAGMLSPDGRCHAFDDRADGFVPGEGVGVVVLKRLSDALARRRSHLRRDSRLGHQPGRHDQRHHRAQRRVAGAAGARGLRRASASIPSTIQLVEAHGTGTKLGDPIEVEALTQRVSRKDTDTKQFCALGSVKTNIGHTATAAGVAGVHQGAAGAAAPADSAVAELRAAAIAHIDFENSPFYVNTRLREWERGGAAATRRAAVSSFGFSGTNAHLVIEEAPPLQRAHASRPGYLHRAVGAHRRAAARAGRARWCAIARERAAIDCGNVSFTLLVGRKHFNHRLACVARDRQELLGCLGQWLERGKAVQVYVAELREKDRREQIALKRYGNESIVACREGAAGTNYQEMLASIADLYLQGYRLEFGKLFPEREYARIPLPTYPFATDRFWVTPKRPALLAAPAATTRCQ